MATLSRSLLPNDQKEAEALAKDLFSHFEELDAAAQEKNYSAVASQYKAALKDLDSFIELIPEA
jgi:hypothetical protein